MNTRNFRFKTKFLLDDVTFALEISSENFINQDVEAGIRDRQVITLTQDDAGVNMIRCQYLAPGSQFRLSGNGTLEDADEHQLKIFAMIWVVVVQHSLMEMNGGSTMSDEGRLAVDPAMFLGAQEFMEILEHFFPDMF